MSLISLYTSYLESNNIEYDIIYMDKYGTKEASNAKNIYRHECKIDRSWSKAKKIKSYLSFRKYAKKILIKEKYDFVIVWGIETSIMFVDYLVLSMKNKYILNIRDYPLIEKKLVFTLLKRIIKASKFTTISSVGFRKFLPSHNYIMMHSLNKNVLDELQQRKKLRGKSEVIRVCFLGYVRFFEQDKKLMDALANDDRYVLQFFGVGSEILREYAVKNNIKNVEFIQSFNVEETSKLLERADIINNLYGNESLSLTTAVSIKYYYAVYLRLPILVYEDTYMGEISNDIGFIFDENYTDLAERLYDWYHGINFKEFNRACENILKTVDYENQQFLNILNQVFKN